MDDHRRVSELCASLTAQRDALRAEKRSLEERVRELDAELRGCSWPKGLAEDPETGRRHGHA